MASCIRCPECCFCIGKLSDFVTLAKNAIYQESIFSENSKHANYDPEKMCFNPSITPSLEKIFDALNIKHRCCRMRLVAKTHFDRIYK